MHSEENALRGVDWAWQFLRRNESYRRRFEKWNNATSTGRRRYSKADERRILKLLDDAGSWKARMMPWIQCALERQLPFVDSDEKDGHQTWMDPMNFLLNRWIDPAEDEMPDGAFDRAALIQFSQVHALSPLGKLGTAMGLFPAFDRNTDLEEQWVVASPEKTVIFEPGAGAAERVVFCCQMAFTFDLMNPIDAQMSQLKVMIDSERKWLESLWKAKRIPMVSEPGALKRVGLREALAMLDAAASSKTRAEAIRFVAKDQRLLVKESRYKVLDQALSRGERIRDYDYRFLAFSKD